MNFTQTLLLEYGDEKGNCNSSVPQLVPPQADAQRLEPAR